MGILRQSGDTFFEDIPSKSPNVRWSEEVAKITYHIQPLDIDHDERYYTVKFGHVQDPNKFDTFAEAEAYIRLIHSIKE